MQLQNLTQFPADIFRGCIDEHRIAASVALRVTYDIHGEELRIAEKQPWIVSAAPWESPVGPAPGDELFYRGGVDIMVFGSARSPGRRPVEAIPVRIDVGQRLLFDLVVFGPRSWVRSSRETLTSTQPIPVDEVPLDLQHAFGGTTDWDQLPIPYIDNPKGKGFYLDPEQAAGQPLPQIENPRSLVQKWNDRPSPVGVGLCPSEFGPKLRQFVTFDAEGYMKTLHPKFFNHSFPEMIADRVSPGEIISVAGVLFTGNLRIQVPSSVPWIELQFGAQATRAALRIDQIGIEVDRGRVFISYRYPFRYRIIPLQKRACRLIGFGVKS
jgi:hypothetical protein